MKKVLIIGPSFFYFNQSIADAFKTLGYDYLIFAYDEPLHPFNLRNRIIHKTRFLYNHFYTKSRTSLNILLISKYDSFRPDLVFIYNGDYINADTIDYFKLNSKVVIWMLDSIIRHPYSEQIATKADALFCFEETDVEYLKTKQIQAYFLPQACDPGIYHPMDLQKDIDLLFVGTLYNYPNRVELLKKIISAYPQYKIKICGVYKPWYKNPVKWLFREKRHIFNNKNVSAREVNELYNRSKLVLNIHHNQSKNGANPKVFEISATSAYQVVDYNLFINTVFNCGEVAFYRDEQELLQLIPQLLLSDNSCNIKLANDRIKSDHYFINRIQEIISLLSDK